jgi:hypothetical protein
LSAAAGLGLAFGLLAPRTPGGGESGGPRPGPVDPAAPAAATEAPTLAPEAARAALVQLGDLPVARHAPRNDYDRAHFGQRWADVDRNGCDTRNDVLRRDLQAPVFKARTRDCVVLEGTLDDPYTGRRIAFEKRRADAVQIDHVVSLSNAWRTGAQALTPERRTAFANDPDNLLAVDGPTNEDKGDDDAAEWLPPRAAFRCEFVARQITVKARYGLWVTPEERVAMARALEPCAGR